MFRNALSLPLTFLAILGLATFAGCANESNFEPDPNRAPLGKADHLSNTCQDACGGKSAGSCYCDDDCTYYGDCCDDKVAICDAPQETACGGWLGDTCDASEYCHFEDAAICGWADASGVCADPPQACTQIFAPVCGCDGETYSNSCFANAAGTSVSDDGPCETPPPFCGGFGGIQCPAGLECIDDPNDNCDNNNGGADCGGICVEPQGCQPVLCEIACSNGFKVGADGCEICACADPPAPVDSCQDSCGGQSNSGACYCDDACVGYGDCCGDFEDECAAEPGREPASGICIKNSNDECQTDSDCNVGGCGGALCFNPDISSGISTCECTTPTTVSGCGCVEGSCTWYNE